MKYIIMALLLGTGTARAGDWICAVVSGDGDTTFINVRSIQLNGSVCQYWALDTNHNLKFGTPSTAYAMQLEEVNVRSGKIRLVTMYYYDSRGNVLRTFKGEPTAWSLPPPDSQGEDRVNFIRRMAHNLSKTPHH